MDAETTVLLTHPIGLHARPAVKLAQLVVTFDANAWVRLQDGGEWVKARSTAQVMKLSARHGQQLQVGATGPEADSVVQAVVDLIKRNFDEVDDDPALPTNANALEPTPTSGMLAGTPVSQGIALGITHLIQPDGWHTPCSEGTPVVDYKSEEQRLRSAVTDARDALHTLTHRHTTANDVIGFQISMLDDPDFINPVIACIHSGQSADSAWSEMLSQRINEFEQLTEDYHRQRAMDLRDLDQRLKQRLSGSLGGDPIPAAAVILASELRPSQLLELPAPRAIVTHRGSAHDHTALLARALGIPMLVAVNITQIKEGTSVLVDADRGCIIVDPQEEALESAQARIRSCASARVEETAWRGIQIQTVDGKPIQVTVNVDHLSSLEQLQVNSCDGIGLVRTELLFENDQQLRNESLQVERYQQLLAWAAGRPVTIRTLDIAPDKSVPGLRNATVSALGLRGIRYSLAYPDLFRVQLRALLRAAASGPLEVLLPMVTWPHEVESTRQLMRQLLGALHEEGFAARLPRLGIMLEVPAAALQIEAFSVDFISVGSNDLTQYVLAADRSCAELQYLHTSKAHSSAAAHRSVSLTTPVLALIERAVQWGEKQEIPVSACGEAASVPECLNALLRVGIRSFTVSPNALGPVKKYLATHQIEP